MSKALVVLSGGQDSTTCLYWAIKEFGRENVSSLSFDYGQRHKIELDAAKKVAEIAAIAHTILPIDTFAALGGNALTDSIEVADEATESNDSDKTTLPNTFVPGRNLIFLTFAAAYAYQRSIEHLITGVAQTDYSGYPDCRENTLSSLEHTLRLGMEYNITIHTPLMNLNKSDTVLLAEKLGAMDAMAYTHTCYNGEQPPCGHCQACLLRAKGFAEAKRTDPLIERCQYFSN
ncbi:7-cyano-7-deazaguanine synthase QueC [sulfur-oxidizing endosymbiont of Gigantopelta aegis]|uniref:7-cyano-7-deazaguanine synthase QueC n=1 Tax=sulfur-oxidizing endosymbiont of Gigantopelta aegis TaxID=2794934 RepID=UPI0018DDB974|nr:7-cyano-7-deazaguanine synthase QueC [sulfur-oxidizing endosymbiont of Gigantopelta aegis]